MYNVIREFKIYLENECRFNQDLIVNYLGNLPIIFDHLGINTITDINPQNVASVWRQKRWENTGDGIRISDRNESGYLTALKMFLRYLEEKGRLRAKGLSEIIRVPEARTVRLRGLSRAEQKKLREFLLYNVRNDTQRRETALLLFLLETGCALSDALALNVHSDGYILTARGDEQSGSFYAKFGEIFAKIKNEDGDIQDMKVSPEAIHFLNFYLENRKYHNAILFLSDARRNLPSRLSEKKGEKIIERVFEKAGTPTRKGTALQILRCTAIENGIRSSRRNRQIISLNADAANHGGTASKPQMWNRSFDRRVA